MSSAPVNREREFVLSSTTSSINTKIFGTTNANHNELPCGRSYVPVFGGTKWKVSAKNFKKRIPRSRAVYFILLINVLESFCFLTVVQSAVDTVIHTFQQLKIRNTYYADTTTEDSKFDLAAGLAFGIQIGFPTLFYPIGGVLGDVYLGRHFISVLCMIISFVSYVVLSLALSIANNVADRETTITFGIVVPLLALLLIAVSDGVFQMNWLTFGADQLINSPSEEVSSYIYCWYWTKNFGAVLALLTDIVAFGLFGLFTSNVALKGVISSVISFLSAVIMAIAIFVDLYARHLYDKERVNRNPIKQICGVVHNALTSRPRKSRFMSAFRYGEDPPSGLDFAREYHEGNYTDEEVEDVKSCGRVLLMIVVMSGYSAIYFAFENKSISQFQGVVEAFSTSSILSSVLNVSLTTLIDSTLILFLLPLWNNLIFPLMGHYSPNTRKRIGVGTFLGVIGMLLAALLYLKQLSPTLTAKLLILPLIVIIIAESLVLVPALEFIYAQSPDNMKGLLIGSHYFLIGFWATVAVLVLNKLPDLKDLNQLYYLVYAGVGLFGLVLFTIVSCFYRNRQRNNPVSDIMRIASYY